MVKDSGGGTTLNSPGCLSTCAFQKAFYISLILWNEVRDIVQETGIKAIPKKKKCKKAKQLSGEALEIAMERREAKSKGEKER